jgi:hypothetical protein
MALGVLSRQLRLRLNLSDSAAGAQPYVQELGRSWLPSAHTTFSLPNLAGGVFVGAVCVLDESLAEKRGQA